MTRRTNTTKKGLGPEPSWAEHKDQAPHPVARSGVYELKIQNLNKLKSQPWDEVHPIASKEPGKCACPWPLPFHHTKRLFNQGHQKTPANQESRARPGAEGLYRAQKE